MAYNPNSFVDGVMNGFSLHIEPPSYLVGLKDEQTLLKLYGPRREKNGFVVGKQERRIPDCASVRHRLTSAFE